MRNSTQVGSELRGLGRQRNEVRESRHGVGGAAERPVFEQAYEIAHVRITHNSF